MRADSALWTMSPAPEVPGEDVATWNTAADTHGSPRAAASRPQQIGYLVRRALLFLESDHEVTRSCLKSASALLGCQPHGTGESGAVTNHAFRSGGLARWQAKRASAYIEANLEAKLDTRALADLVSLSKSHFSRAFKRSLGLPPMAYVAMRRVERAKVMMTSTAEQLTQIALACGFADQPHLNRSFRRIVGITPGLWRRTNAGPAHESPQTHQNDSKNSSLPHTIEHETMSVFSS